MLSKGGDSSHLDKMCIRDRSSYEVNDIVHLMREQDPHVIVNMIKTENFYGGFYQAPIE